jgi:hypothetical protein
VNNKPFIMTLCKKCRDEFQSTNRYRIYRINREEMTKESCTRCTVLFGYDYEIKPKENWGNRK